MPEDRIEQWGVVEIMGHSKYAGMLSKSDMLGSALLRVDVPGVGGNPAFTKLFGENAIFSITFTSEKVARQVAESLNIQPMYTIDTDLVPRSDLYALRDKMLEKFGQPALSYGVDGDDYDQDDFGGPF